MKKFFLYTFFILLFFSYSSVYALCENSKSCILIDNNSGRILYSKNSNEKMLIASTTKLMTFLIAYENGNLDDIYKVGEEVLSMYGTSIYLSKGEDMSLRDLLYGLILRSGNDSSVVIAHNVFGDYDKFISKMNERALELGMNDTVFYNPHGLDEDTKNYSTSYDMALLSKYLHTIPFYLEVSSTKNYETSTSLKAYDWYNRNKMISSYKYTVSGKNGYTPLAGKTLVSGAVLGDLSLSSVSLNDNDIYNTHKSLYEYGFSTYENYLIINKDMFSYKDDYYKGTLYVKNSFYYPVLEEEKNKISLVLKIIKGIDTNKSSVVGKIYVYLDKDIIHTDDLYLKRGIGTKTLSFFEKIILFFKNLFVEKNN